MIIALGGDHAGFEYKNEIITALETLGLVTKDFGPYSTESCDYPDYVHPLSEAVEKKECDLGIVICGSGNGVAMTANKHQGIRCALVWNVELAKLAKLHGDANVVSIPARFVSLEIAKEIARVFIESKFEGGRHQNRINKIPL
tara:strand:- start:40 stop:468 length:429 start_codon:yes stop_codon:yes gene_type:complete